MKSLWRKIGFIMAWSILVLGTTGSIVAAVTAGYAGNGFALYCQIFVPTMFFFTLLMVYLEHTNNIEMRMDQTYRKENNLPQLSENSYTNLPISSAPSNPYQQPIQQYQQPVQQYQQPVQQYQQPAPAPVQQPAPAAPAAQPWICTKCGTSNNPNANFCKGCGSNRS